MFLTSQLSTAVRKWNSLSFAIHSDPPISTMVSSPIRNRNLLRTAQLSECRCSALPFEARVPKVSPQNQGRRAVMGCLLAAVTGISLCEAAKAVSTSRRALRGAKIPESEFTVLPNGLKYYDLKIGGGPEAVKGSRVAVRLTQLKLLLSKYIDLNHLKSLANSSSLRLLVLVHYVAKWKGLTFMTSRQGLGVGGGTPYGFDVGQSERGAVLKGLDFGVQGMRVGGQRLLIVPPELAYGNKGVQEIPPNATIELDVELLAIKQSPFGSAVKIVEG